MSNLAAFRRGWASLSQDFRGKGSSLGNIFLVSRKLDTFCYLKVQTGTLRAVVFAQYRRAACDRQTDGLTDGIAIASTALAMRALWRAVKTLPLLACPL